MRFDLRIAIGGLFTVYGVLLALYGLLGDQAQYSRSLGLNVNLLWGAVLLVCDLAKVSSSCIVSFFSQSLYIL